MALSFMEYQKISHSLGPYCTRLRLAQYDSSSWNIFLYPIQGHSISYKCCQFTARNMLLKHTCVTKLKFIICTKEPVQIKEWKMFPFNRLWLFWYWASLGKDTTTDWSRCWASNIWQLYSKYIPDITIMIMWIDIGFF